jgi:hypothetical protein
VGWLGWEDLAVVLAALVLVPETERPRLDGPSTAAAAFPPQQPGPVVRQLGIEVLDVVANRNGAAHRNTPRRPGARGG